MKSKKTKTSKNISIKLQFIPKFIVIFGSLKTQSSTNVLTIAVEQVGLLCE